MITMCERTGSEQSCSENGSYHLDEKQNNWIARCSEPTERGNARLSLFGLSSGTVLALPSLDGPPLLASC